MTVVTSTGSAPTVTAHAAAHTGPTRPAGSAVPAGPGGLFTREAAVATFGLDAELVVALARTGRLRSVTGHDGGRLYAAGDLLDLVRSLRGRR
jgi:hypothetical protein